MTDQTPEQTDDQTPVLGAEIDADGQTDLPEGDGTGEPNPNSREARYRVRAREAETALEAANARVEAMNHREIQRLAGAHLSSPEDLLTFSGNSVSDYLNPETGDIDSAKVEADALEILRERPGLKPAQPAWDRSQGLSAPVKSEPTWEALFSG